MNGSLQTGRKVMIDFMTENELTDTFNMIQNAAQLGEGYGIDEFPSEQAFRQEIEGSFCFAITCKDSGKLLAGFILAISRFYRGAANVVDPFVIVHTEERKQGLGEYALRKAIAISRMFGYKAMYLDTFSNNFAIQRIVEKIGRFTRVGFLPVGGRLSNGDLVGSIIYYSDLSCDVLPEMT